MIDFVSEDDDHESDFIFIFSSDDSINSYNHHLTLIIAPYPAHKERTNHIKHKLCGINMWDAIQ